MKSKRQNAKSRGPGRPASENETNLHVLIPMDMHHWIGSLAKVRSEQAAKKGQEKRITMSDCVREILEREMTRQTKAA